MSINGSRTFHRRLKLAMGALVCFLSLAALGAPAQAHPSSGCLGADRHVEAEGTKHATDYDGFKANFHWATPLNECQRVNSIGVLHGSGSVEWGWVIGWIGDGTSYCPLTYYDVPTVFAAWQNTGGPFHCTVVEQMAGSGGSYHTMKVSDSNSDSLWEYSRDGSVYVDRNMDFDSGLAITNAERENLSYDDSPYAHFQSMEMHLKSSSLGWQNLDGNGCYFDNDTGSNGGYYKWIGAQQHYVEEGAGTC